MLAPLMKLQSGMVSSDSFCYCVSSIVNLRLTVAMIGTCS